MKVLVCGDRLWGDSDREDWAVMDYRLCRLLSPDLTIIQGGCLGADRLAETWCKKRGVECVTFPADWKRRGKAAGPIRNRQMLDEKPDLVIAFHRKLDRSRGTKDCIREAVSRGIEVEVWPTQPEVLGDQ